MLISYLDFRKFRATGRMFLVSLLSCIVIGGFAGCSSDEEPEEYQITFPQTEVPTPVFSTNGGNEKVSFTATSDWHVSVSATRADSWCSVYPTSGKAGSTAITITTQPNDTYDDREATITLVCGTERTELKVLQKQKNALTTTKSRFEVAANGGEVEIEVNANITFECTVDADASSWITPIEEKQSTRGMVTTKKRFAVAANPDMKSREGKIIVKSGELKEEITVSQEAAKPIVIGDTQEVDLGLSVVWAAWNVGASKPEEVGNFYAWGETTTKNAYYINSYTLSQDYIDGAETRLDATHDAATANWGNKWRMPTDEEIMELKRSDKLQKRRYTQNGVEGLLCTAQNGNSIFFPNTGWRDYSTTVQNSDHLGFWSNTVSSTNTEKAYSYYSDPSGTIFEGIGSVLQTVSLRCNGLTVRPVRRPDVQFSDYKAENITENTADVSFAVALDGTTNDNIVKTGIQVSAVKEITYHSTKESVTASIENGRISVKLDNLSLATTYFIRPFMQSKKDGTYYGEIQQFTTAGALSTEQWIDLGLSVKWASRNIGANSPTESGSLFGWAETEPRENDTYIPLTQSKYYSYKEDINIYHSPNSLLSQKDVVYHFSKYDETDGKTVLEAEDDAATATWQDEARTPTKAEWEELIENCDRQEATVSGVKGWLFTSKKNQNAIFLPAVDYWTATVQVEELKSYAKNSEVVLKTYYRYDDAYYWDDKDGFYGGSRSYCNRIRAVHK